MPAFSVITPSYNCGPFIHRGWESLRDQTFRDFEWIIVDDGSVDDTAEQVESFRELADFPIQYHRQENAGKMTAVNNGVKLASGEYTVILDADDRLKPHTLETMLSVWNSLTPAERKSATGVVGHCEDQHGNFIGSRFPESPLICDKFDMEFKYGVDGEKVSFVRTEIMREFPFETGIDKFVPEAHAWLAMAMKYNEVYVNDTFRVYYIDQDDRQSLMHQGLTDVAGHHYFYLRCLNDFYPRLPWKERLRFHLLFLRASWLLEPSVLDSIARINSPLRRGLSLALAPAGWLLARRHRPSSGGSMKPVEAT